MRKSPTEKQLVVLSCTSFICLGPTSAAHQVGLPYFARCYLTGLIVSIGKRKLQRLRMELDRLREAKHPNLVYIYGASLAPHGNNGQRLAVVTDPVQGSTLEGFLAGCGELRADKALNLLRQITSGLQALHSADLVHRSMSFATLGLNSFLINSCSRPRAEECLHFSKFDIGTYCQARRCWLDEADI
jgi:serine/threonine protein kinase